jgi:hypothetical protein
VGGKMHEEKAREEEMLHVTVIILYFISVKPAEGAQNVFPPMCLVC